MSRPGLFDAELDESPLEVLAQCPWLVHWGGINNAGGIEGKLTKCRLGSVLFYVRENISVNHFVVSSGERQAFKRGDASHHAQLLELCAPAELWRRLAVIVRQVDALHRNVRRNRNFTSEWAERLLTKETHRGKA